MITKSSIGAMLLVSGCCIGAGMVGLPVLSAQAGFIPTTIAMIFIYGFTTFTGLLIMEAALWYDRPVNLMTIVESAFGKSGKIATMLLFLFLFYCLFVAYFDGGGQLFSEVLSAFFNAPIPKDVGILVFLGLTAAITYHGTKLVVQVNRVLLTVLVVSYLMLVFMAIPHVSAINLTHVNLEASLFTIPILMICFGYQNLVPSLVTYLKNDVKQIRFAIIAGNFIPFIIYLVWNAVILGMIPASQLPRASGANLVTQLLSSSGHLNSVNFFLKTFSLFAILTPILPITLSFVDFLKDGFIASGQRGRESNLPYYGMVFLPPLVFTLLYPHLFLEALGFAGGFIDVLLFGMIPALVILHNRKKYHAKGRYQLLGGRATPILVILVCLVILLIKHYTPSAG